MTSSACRRSAALLLSLPIIILAAALSCLTSVWAAERQPVRVGTPSPPFSLSDLSGQTRRLPQDAAGSPVVIHFWATSCQFCLEEMPAIDSLYKVSRKKGLQVYAVNVGDSREQAKEFTVRTPVSYPVLLDRDRSVAGKFGITGLPATFFIDRNGVIRQKLLGAASKETLAKYIQNLF